MSISRLLAAARDYGTPLYVYDIDILRARIFILRKVLPAFKISYAIKCNPSIGLMSAIANDVDLFDASSFAEILRAQEAGIDPARISFSGPAKRKGELEGAVEAGTGAIVLESLREARALSRIAAYREIKQKCLVRINPGRVPKNFGASMTGGASQFGFDEEAMACDLQEIQALSGINLAGFHIYSGTNCLDADAIVENFSIFVDIFERTAVHLGMQPESLIFGSGFGLPYLPDDVDLDHDRVGELVRPLLGHLDASPALSGATRVVEIGRWLMGPAGWLLTSVIATKTSRGKDIRLCDAGFNNHLAACGMMGSVFRRNWVFENLSNPNGPISKYVLTGPLCTSIDRLASGVEMPELRVDDVIAIPNSGAYGLTASPTRFISHPEPQEVLLDKGDSVTDVTETRHNHWPGSRPGA